MLSVNAGVIKKAKTEVSFAKFGKLTMVQEERVTDLKKETFTDSKFKGKGIMGRLAGKFALKSGVKGEIIDLQEMLIYSLDHKKKEYRVRPIEKIDLEAGELGKTQATEETAQEEQPEEPSDIKITRNEFKVKDTGEKKTINGFLCRRYEITWLLGWENVRTGEKGTNRLITTVWTTPLEGAVKQSFEEESKFQQNYMKKIGLEIDLQQQEILGSNWLALLMQMDQEGEAPSQEMSTFAGEMKKIKGYPILVDGKYYQTKEGGPAEEAEEEGGGVKKMFGGFAKKALKKSLSRKKKGNEPAFTYYLEVLELQPAPITPETITVPAGYKKKD
jgi:hypothetical protein